MEILRTIRISGIDFAVFVMGFTSLAWQFIIIREMLVTFHGNEFTFGIIFGNWLLLEAIGCYFWRKKAELTTKPLIFFVCIQLLIGVFCFVSVTLLRSAKYLLEIPLGEVLGLHLVGIVSLIVLAPVSVSKGALFPLASRNMGLIKASSEAPSKVYLIEALGSFTAGLIFIFYLIEHFDHITLITAIFLLNIISVIILLHLQRAYNRIKIFSLGACIVLIIAVIISFPKWFDITTSRLLWYEYSLLQTKNSVYSNIAVIESNKEYTFFQNGAPFITIPTPLLFVEEKAHIPLLFHPKPEEILLIGSGVGGLISEVLKHPVSNIKYAEQDPLVIELTKQFLTPLTEFEITSDKLSVINVEGRRFVQTFNNKFDCIVITFPLPTTLQLNRFFTLEFFEILKTRLKENGVVAISLPGSETFLSDELEKLNNTLYKTLQAVFPYVRTVVGEINIYLASNDKIVMDDVSLLAERFDKRNIRAGLINKAYLEYKFDASRFEAIEESIKKDSAPILNSDKTPVAVFQSLLFHTSIVSPTLVNILHNIDAVPFSLYLIILFLVIVGLVFFQSKGRRFLYIDTAIITTGFTSMVIYILLIFYFQIYFGNVYQYVGLLTAIFMLGSAIGAYFGRKQLHNNLVLIEFGIVFLILGIGVFTFFEIDIALIQILIFLTMVLIGVLTGFEFPIAVRRYQSLKNSLCLYPGKLYALDLIGAFFGALLTGVVFVPTIGIQSTLILLFILKIGSMTTVKLGEINKQLS